MIQKKYPSNIFVKIYTLGLKRYGAKIDKNVFIINSLILPEKIKIENIKSITLKLREPYTVLSTLFFYCYVIKDEKRKEYFLPYSLLDSKTYQELIKDLLLINPNIKTTSYITKFIKSRIVSKKLQ